MKTQKMFYSVSEVADILGVEKQTVTRLINTGKLKSIKLGRIHRIAIAHFNTVFGNSPQTDAQHIIQKPVKKAVKTLYAQVDADKYFWLRDYRNKSGLKMHKIMNECLDDFRRKKEMTFDEANANKIPDYYISAPCDNKTINGKYSLLD
jgi:excisionase family DNA binding protein